MREAGVASIPVSAFYEADPVTTILRLCFSKADETLDAGIERLAKARGWRGPGLLARSRALVPLLLVSLPDTAPGSAQTPA